LYSYIPALEKHALEKQPDFKLYTSIQMINFIVMIILRSGIFTTGRRKHSHMCLAFCSWLDRRAIQNPLNFKIFLGL